ncbi:Naphthalene 1,2-dioxygenase/salicylate 5-hydroxylase systems, ferredoxin component [Paraburkholderia caffeinitolerans]|uniref:Naphthalene 1,2-dioxygenase/salicylate 5-hydroxylase systems, ferredoxin component n=1 Tax=Paraburkholderia caffeinitolerans TaxID=1723730 RepID=A0A6J5FZR8_9BURK|nr:MULTISPECIES: non-heme iron oxygenase ferredoxin subunit [Paraburkholderia]CAB3788559.1 Naphthalene 1,2-dioxygenase/salicylate 5-hydroxylase systems, ferredoxin component [Paraburkholderia caffeinitolerans]
MTTHWIKVAELATLPQDDVCAAEAAGTELALYRVGDCVYATADLCTHGRARLSDGFLEGHEIECPLHQGRFDVRTGTALCEPLTCDVARFDVRVENGDVMVCVDAAAT